MASSSASAPMAALQLPHCSPKLLHFKNPNSVFYSRKLLFFSRKFPRHFRSLSSNGQFSKESAGIEPLLLKRRGSMKMKGTLLISTWLLFLLALLLKLTQLHRSMLENARSMQQIARQCFFVVSFFDKPQTYQV